MSVTIRMTRAAIFFESVSAIFAPTADGFVSASSTPSITICNTQSDAEAESDSHRRAREEGLGAQCTTYSLSRPIAKGCSLAHAVLG